MSYELKKGSGGMKKHIYFYHFMSLNISTSLHFTGKYPFFVLFTSLCLSAIVNTFTCTSVFLLGIITFKIFRMPQNNLHTYTEMMVAAEIMTGAKESLVARSDGSLYQTPTTVSVVLYLEHDHNCSIIVIPDLSLNISKPFNLTI